MVARILLMAVLVVFGCSQEAVSDSGTRKYSLDVGGTTRTYYVHVPKTGAAEKSVPAVIALHGALTGGKAMERFSGLSDAADRYGFVAVYPNGSGFFPRLLFWNGGNCCGYAVKHQIDDVAFITMLITHLISDFNVDPSRVYVTGVSNGAIMAYRLAAEIPDKIAAIAPVAGTLGTDPGLVHAPMPVVHFHGADDKFVPFAGGQGDRNVAGIQHTSVEDTIKLWVHVDGASKEPAITELPSRHNDGTSVVKYAYGTKEDPETVVLYKIVGGGHAWPGRPYLSFLLGKSTTEISANDVMWEFFAAHPKKAVRPQRLP